MGELVKSALGERPGTGAEGRETGLRLQTHAKVMLHFIFQGMPGGFCVPGEMFPFSV